MRIQRMHIDDFKITLNDFLSDTGISKSQLASDARVPQSQVSDWSNGKGVRFTENAKRVLDAIEDHRNSSNARLPENLELAVKDLLNGKQSRIQTVETILHSLKGAFR